MTEVPYTILDIDDRPFIEIVGNGSSELFSPEELAALCFSCVKQALYAGFTREPASVVISIPADFTERQYKAVANACAIAGVQDWKIVREPIAACFRTVPAMFRKREK
jgi:molecular chaperone DnaK (HSP70)